MTKREVLQSAQAIWLDAAMRDLPQFRIGGAATWNLSGAHPECALTVLKGKLPIWKLLFRCAEHAGDRFPEHFNNAPHNWDWLTLARKLGEPPYDLIDPDKEMRDG